MMVNQAEEELRAIQNTIITLKKIKTKYDNEKVNYKLSQLLHEEYKILKNLRIK